MGIFDFFKKKQAEEPQAPIDLNTYIREELKRRLEAMGHTVVIEDGIVYVDRETGILIEILDDPNLHPSVVKVGVRIAVRDYFGQGLSEILAGIGETLEQKVDSALTNLLTVTLPPVLDAFTDSHYPELDFSESNHGREILWHPKLGNPGFQGKWADYPENGYIFKLMQPWLKDRLLDRKFNWLKIYIARQADGSITGDCSLNNNFHEDGYMLLEEYAKTWKDVESFRAVKQFILFRRCDACDE